MIKIIMKLAAIFAMLLIVAIDFYYYACESELLFSLNC
jgi:hypothetical protein